MILAAAADVHGGRKKKKEGYCWVMAAGQGSSTVYNVRNETTGQRFNISSRLRQVSDRRLISPQSPGLEIILSGSVLCLLEKEGVWFFKECRVNTIHDTIDIFYNFREIRLILHVIILIVDCWIDVRSSQGSLLQVFIGGFLLGFTTFRIVKWLIDDYAI